MRYAGQYYYVPSGRFFRIYRYTHVNASGAYAGTPVAGEPLHTCREDARKRVYELNGWKYTPGK